MVTFRNLRKRAQHGCKEGGGGRGEREQPGAGQGTKQEAPENPPLRAGKHPEAK